MHKTRMEPTELFFKYYKILFHTETITNLETGEVFKLSSTDIHLYCYFIDQFKSYTKRQLQFFESIKSIESKTPHASDKSIRDFIKKFSELGLIKYQKIKKGGKFHSNLYTLVLTPDEAKGIVSFNTIWSSEEETSPQEPQQPEINPALPSSDDIHTSADSGSDDSQDEQQTESPPDTSTEKIAKRDVVYPWGTLGAFNPNRSVTEPAKQWALSKTGGNVYQAERYLMNYLSQLYAKPVTLSFHEEEESEELPF